MKNQKDSIKTEKFKIQDNEYRFPYHYIPYFDSDFNGNRLRILENGFEYLCYINHVSLLIHEMNAGSKILEVGCGDGKIINHLQNKNIVGVDLSEKAINFAKAFNPEINFIYGDASEILDTFPIIIAIEVLEHIPDEIIPQFWETLYNKCELNGNIIISVPSVNKRMIKKHFRHYDQKRLNEELAMAGLNNKLEIINVEYIYKETKLIKLWKRFTSNKYWVFEIHYIRKKIWKYIWNHLRIAESDTGYHLIAVLKKIR